MCFTALFSSKEIYLLQFVCSFVCYEVGRDPICWVTSQMPLTVQRWVDQVPMGGGNLATQLSPLPLRLLTGIQEEWREDFNPGPEMGHRRSKWHFNKRPFPISDINNRNND